MASVYGSVYGTEESGEGFPLLATGNVKISVDRGDGQIGTYDGSDRWSDPGISNVREDITYKANSLTDNRTGTLDVAGGTTVRNITITQRGISMHDND